MTRCTYTGACKEPGVVKLDLKHEGTGFKTKRLCLDHARGVLAGVSIFERKCLDPELHEFRQCDCPRVATSLQP